MKAKFASRQLEYSGWPNMLCAYGSPLPPQGEGEGEGSSEATRVGSEILHLSPLPFSKGRGEKAHVGFGANSRQSERDGDDSHPRLAIKKASANEKNPGHLFPA